MPTSKSTRGRLTEYMRNNYGSVADADSFVHFAEGVLEFALEEMKRDEPQAKLEISSIEIALDYIGHMLDAEEELAALELAEKIRRAKN